MAIQISGEAQVGVILENMTPRQIVAELDKFVVGQRLAKRAVAIALRNAKEEKPASVREAAATRAEDRLLQLLVPPRPISSYLKSDPEEDDEDELAATREKFRDKLRSGALDHRRGA